MKNQKNVVFVAANKELQNPVYDNRLWLTARNENYSRRGFIDEIEKAIYGFARKGGVILIPGGRVWHIPVVGEVMGCSDGRWLSYYLKAVDGRPKHKPSPLTLERRRIIDLYYRIEKPEVAERFKS